MIYIIYSSLLSYMIFFSIVIAPTANKTLDNMNKSVFLRAVFPRNFIYGFFVSIFGVYYSYLQDVRGLFGTSILIMLGFLVNYFLIMPRINKVKDMEGKNLNKKKTFLVWHTTSVIIYLIQIILTIFILVQFNI